MGRLPPPKPSLVCKSTASLIIVNYVLEMALLMQEQVDVVSKKLGYDIKVRVGINRFVVLTSLPPSSYCSYLNYAVGMW